MDGDLAIGLSPLPLSLGDSSKASLACNTRIDAEIKRISLKATIETPETVSLLFSQPMNLAFMYPIITALHVQIPPGN